MKSEYEILSNPPRLPLISIAGNASRVDWNGRPTELLCESEHSCGLYTVQRATVQPGPGPIIGHAHNFGEGFYLLSGRAEFVVGNSTSILSPGDFIHIQGGTSHRFHALEETQLVTFCAPAGFEVFQRRAILEVERRGVSHDRELTLSILKELAPQFGIDLSPPENSWAVEPNVHITRSHEGERVAAVGDIYRFLAESEHTSGSYAIWHATVFPGGGPPPHLHHWEEEGFYILKGSLAFYGNDRRIDASSGTFINLPRHQLHHFHNETDEPAEALILVAPAGLEKMFRTTGRVLSNDIVIAPKPNAEEISRLLSVAPQFGLEIHAGH